MWNWNWWLTFWCRPNGGILTEGEWTKTTSDKTFPTKNPEQNPRTKTPRTIERYFVQGVFVRDFCTTKNREGGPRSVTYFRGVPRGVTKCDRRRSKLDKYSMTYFMDGPQHTWQLRNLNTDTQHKTSFLTSSNIPSKWNQISWKDGMRVDWMVPNFLLQFLLLHVFAYKSIQIVPHCHSSLHCCHWSRCLYASSQPEVMPRYSICVPQRLLYG